MNKTLLISVVILSYLPIGQAQTVDNNENGIAYITIDSPEEGLLFYVDDSLVGSVSETEFEISSGFHKLDVSSVSDNWNAVDWSWQGVIKADSVYTFHVETNHFIMLNTIPFGAKVIINGEYVGTTPYMLKKSTKAVELIMSDYMPVRLESAQLNDKEFINITLVNEIPSEEIESIQINIRIANRKDKIITRSTYLLTGLSGIAAVYFKFEADEAFKKLPDAILLEDQIYLNDRIKKYDDLAAVSFGTFQVGFLYSIYRVISR